MYKGGGLGWTGPGPEPGRTLDLLLTKHFLLKMALRDIASPQLSDARCQMPDANRKT
jgi:hypothetical protein